MRIMTVGLLAALLLSACADEAPTGPSARPTSPAGTAPAGQPRRTITGTARILTAQLRTVPGASVLQWGHLRLDVDFPTDPLFPNDPVAPCLPPNPVQPQEGMTRVLVCGRIFNQGGALYQGGGIYAVSFLGDDGSNLRAPFFTDVVPTAPCRRYELRGVIQLPDALAQDLVTNPTGYQVLFDGATPLLPPNPVTPTRIGGVLDGSAWGPIGTIAETDSFFAANVCTINLAPSPPPI